LQNNDQYRVITEAMMEDASVDELQEVLKEGYDLEQDSSVMNYLFRLEQFLDENDIYAFDGWKGGFVYGEPEIEKFWFKTNFIFPKNLDIAGALRIIGKKKENRVWVKTLDDGRKLVKIAILRNKLDDIERDNRRLAARNAKVANKSHD
jgi:hypothetical protein